MHTAKLWFMAGIPVLLSLTGCLSVARLKDLPGDNASADMENTGAPTKYGRFEHAFSIKGVSQQLVFNSSQEALKQEGFTIAFADCDKGCVKGKRGLRGNEWGMVSGIYFREGDDHVKVKVICIITQDITGGWHQSYAENIANRIARIVAVNK